MNRKRDRATGSSQHSLQPQTLPGAGGFRRRVHLNTLKLFSGPASVLHLISLATNWGLVSLDFLPEGRRKRRQALSARHKPDKCL